MPGGLPSPAIVRNRPRLRPAPPTGRGPGEPAGAVATAGELWLAIHLPHYILESLRRPVAAGSGVGQAPGAASVVVDVGRGGKVVCACDAEAAAAGIVRGMALNSALALLPGLSVLARSVAAERALLEAVATCAGDFTPRVAFEPPDGVLLEVRGSLKLFGGVRRLVACVREHLQSAGVEPRLAIAPAPLAALWFARSGKEVALRSRDSLASRLAPLPLVCTRWPDKSLESLATMGVRTVGDCLRLPRDGFARRFAPEVLRSLDRALGRAPDPRAAFVRRERYMERWNLEPEISDTDRLGRTMAPMLDDLCGYLQARGCAVDALEFRLTHRDAPATRVRLRFAEPTAQAGQMAGLLCERLARTQLPEPVRALRLRSGVLLEAREEAGDLFARGRCGAVGVPQFIERLRARLGADAVQGVRLVPEHRPEAAWEIGDIPRFPGHGSENRGNRGMSPISPISPGCRPLWLLAEPRLLDGLDWPYCEGRLEIEDGPERIESGWWDGRDVRRDYYIARTTGGVRLWVFRERRKDGRWFMHGVFG
ncbi:MAG: DNA polymerase Y family protein [Steroidobacteraceae bacterium]|nr:DNA polymerase Y family protein [Steroidobacteraceae bacterium]